MEVGSSAAAEAPPQQQQQAQPPAGQAQAGALPCKTAAFEANVGGSPCQFSITAYSDRLMVIASQLGTLGSVLHVEKESVLGGGSTFRVDTLLGRRDEPLAELAARQLAERLYDAGADRPLLLCLALQRGAATRQGVQQLVAAVVERAAM